MYTWALIEWKVSPVSLILTHSITLQVCVLGSKLLTQFMYRYMPKSSNFSAAVAVGEGSTEGVKYVCML